MRPPKSVSRDAHADPGRHSIRPFCLAPRPRSFGGQQNAYDRPIADEYLKAAVLDLVGEVGGLLDLEEFRVVLLEALAKALPSDYISLNQVGPSERENWSIVKPPMPAVLHEIFYRLALQNPLAARFMRTRDGRPLRLSDICSPDEFHATQIYEEFYGPLSVEHQIAFALPSDADHVLAIALSRCDHDYTDAERDLLAIARPHLIQAYRTALYISTPATSAPPAAAAPPQEALEALGLTRGQARVLQLIAMGRSTADVARDLQIAPRTVHKHLQRTYEKLGVKDRSAAAQVAWNAVVPDVQGGQAAR
jgi:DNA-binding CsgD family transcriptional regulator